MEARRVSSILTGSRHQTQAEFAVAMARSAFLWTMIRLVESAPMPGISVPSEHEAFNFDLEEWQFDVTMKSPWPDS